MQLQLTTWQRAMCALIIGSVQGDIKTFRAGCNLLDVLELDPEEQARVGFRVDSDGSMFWDDTQHQWSLEIEGNELDMLRERIKAHQWQVSDRIHRGEVEDLLARLGV